MLVNHVVDTTLLPPAERFEFWHQLVAHETAPAHISSAHLHDFVAYARAIDLGRARLTALRYPSLHSARPSRLVRRTEADLYQLALPLAGRSAVTQERREAELNAAEFTLLDTARPHVATHSAVGPGLAETITVQIPHRELPLPPDQVRRLLAARMPTDRGMGVLLARYVRRIAAHPEQYDPGDAALLGGIVVDLIAATLAQHLDAEPALPAQVRQSALRERVVAFVDRHLDDPGLTPQSIADAHHVSLRTLHRLFADESTTVATLIRTRRLDRCRRDLRDPRLADEPVQRIAARWGFTDKAHFSRAFRAAYGCSPRAWRAGE